MRVRLAGFLGLFVAVLISLVLGSSAVAQDKAKAKADNVQGRVTAIRKATSTITVVDTGTIPRMVVYNANTKFLYGHSNDNKPGSLDKVQENYYISCSGSMDAKVGLMATECIYRESR
jgi:hypothetical protein